MKTTAGRKTNSSVYRTSISSRFAKAEALFRVLIVLHQVDNELT
jgi:hypothetical protein